MDKKWLLYLAGAAIYIYAAICKGGVEPIVALGLVLMLAGMTSK